MLQLNSMQVVMKLTTELSRVLFFEKVPGLNVKKTYVFTWIEL